MTRSRYPRRLQPARHNKRPRIHEDSDVDDSDSGQSSIESIEIAAQRQAPSGKLAVQSQIVSLATVVEIVTDEPVRILVGPALRAYCLPKSKIAGASTLLQAVITHKPSSSDGYSFIQLPDETTKGFEIFCYHTLVGHLPAELSDETENDSRVSQVIHLYAMGRRIQARSFKNALVKCTYDAVKRGSLRFRLADLGFAADQNLRNTKFYALLTTLVAWSLAINKGHEDDVAGTDLNKFDQIRARTYFEVLQAMAKHSLNVSLRLPAVSNFYESMT